MHQLAMAERRALSRVFMRAGHCYNQLMSLHTFAPAFLISACLLAPSSLAENSQVLPTTMGKSVPVNLHCPTDNNAQLVIDYSRINGGYARLSVTFDRTAPVRVMLEGSGDDRVFEIIDDVDYLKENDAMRLAFARRLIAMVQLIKDNVCAKYGNSRDIYFKMLQVNRKYMKYKKQQQER